MGPLTPCLKWPPVLWFFWDHWVSDPNLIKNLDHFFCKILLWLAVASVVHTAHVGPLGMSLSCKLFISLCKCLPVHCDTKHVEEIWRILKNLCRIITFARFSSVSFIHITKEKKTKKQSYSFSIKHFTLDLCCCCIHAASRILQGIDYLGNEDLKWESWELFEFPVRYMS